MWVDVDYKILEDRHPSLVENVISKVKKGRSKHKNVDPHLWHWGYSWSLQIGGMISGPDMMQMIAGQKPFPEPEPAKPDAEDLADYERRATIVVAAKIGKSEWGSTERVLKLPPEIADGIIRQKREQEAEQKRIAGLTPAERHQEETEILRQLGRSPGFVRLEMPPRPPLREGDFQL